MADKTAVGTAVKAAEEAAPGTPRAPDPSVFPLMPVALRVAGKTGVVVGGGPIAARKADDLLRAGAFVRAVAPEWGAELEAIAAAHPDRVERITGRFRPRDLDGALLVFAATDDAAVQREVHREAAARGVLCNVVDVTDLCEFHVPATVRRGALSISVATDGAFPLLAVKLRDHLAQQVGEAFGP